MLTLRPYQQSAIAELRSGFSAGHKRQVLCLPTGAGKTVVFSEMVRLAAERGTRTLVLTDRVELFEQTFAALGRVGVRPQRIEPGARMFDPLSPVSVGMVETVKRRSLERFAPALVIADEAHKGNFTAILDRWPDARVIGATATPVGKHFHKYYSNLVQGADIPDLIADGYLSPCRAFQMQEDLSDLEVKAGEYTDDSLNRHFNQRKLFAGVVAEWQARAGGRKTLVFNCNIEHALNVTQAFRDAGIGAEVVTSKTPRDERLRILRAFKQGLFPVLNNCGILTTGYDEPSVECVVMNRATKSLPLWLQCCGRGSRVHPGKEWFTVLDFGMNHNEHGLWAEERIWNLNPPKKGKKEVRDVSPVKSCSSCAALIAPSARTCPWCGAEAGSAERPLAKGAMVEVGPRVPAHLEGRQVSSLTVAELIELEASKKFKPTYIWRVVRTLGLLEPYAKAKGHSSGWVWRQKNEGHGFKDYRI